MTYYIYVSGDYNICTHFIDVFMFVDYLTLDILVFKLYHSYLNILTYSVITVYSTKLL